MFNFATSLNRTSVALLALVACAPANAQQSAPLQRQTSVQTFAPANIKQDAARFEAALKTAYKPGKKTARDLLNEAAARPGQSVDPRAQTRLLSLAVVTDPNDAAGLASTRKLAPGHNARSR
jgi:hypothetical protein